jgi:hypothetical protein
METLILWAIAIVVMISAALGFVLGRFMRRGLAALLAVLLAPFLILLASAGILQSTIVVQTWRDVAGGRMIDRETLSFFMVAYCVATFPAGIGGIIGRILRSR